jgi:hypothetical protein
MKRLFLPPLAAVALLASTALAAQTPAGTAKIVGYDKIPWGASRADIIGQKGTPEFETTDGVGPGMTILAYKSEVGLLGFTVHERDGLIQVARSTQLDPAECDATFAGTLSMFREILAPLEPVGASENPTSDDLCTAVRDGRAKARYTWTDPVNDATLTLEIKPEAGTLQMYLSTPQYRQWYDTRDAPAASAPSAPGEKTLGSLVAHLRAAGLRVGEVAGTDDIAGIAIGGRKVSVFRFAAPDERAVLDEIRRKGAIEVAGERYPVIVNGVWVMGIDAEHPQWRAIAAAFRSF